MWEKAENPWLDTHQNEIKYFQETISEITAAIQSGPDRDKAKEERTRVRKEYKEAKMSWEESWWLQIVDEAKDAEGKGNIKKMYQTLKKNWGERHSGYRRRIF